MTTAYSPLLGLALPVTGELSGTWGDTVNNAITSLLDSAVAGTTTISSDADVTLTTTTGAANTAREAVLLWTAGGTVTRTITAPAQSKVYVVINASSSTQSIKLVGTGPTTGVTVIKGEVAVCVWNGSDFVKASSIGPSGVTSPVSGGTGVVNNAAMTVTGSGNFAYTRTLTGATNVTFPTSGTLATLAGTESFSNKSFNSALVAAVSGTAPLYLARAWVHFNGTGTVAIRNSRNVSSITDNGTGDYTVNFTTAMQSDTYAAPIWVATAGSSASFGAQYPSAGPAPTVSALRFVTRNTSTGTASDCSAVQVAIFD